MEARGQKDVWAIRILMLSVFFFSTLQQSEVLASDAYAIVYSSQEPNGREIYLADNEGSFRIKIIGVTGNDGYPAVSPDGERLAFYGKYDDRETWSIHTA
ncbi:hypothetical protein, partial [Marinobacter alexandrii]|uniref:hypothetical protein n=1 Tax=Marinobacter alexandrii TaxID=2570351 RepID=UPI003299F8C4